MDQDSQATPALHAVTGVIAAAIQPPTSSSTSVRPNSVGWRTVPRRITAVCRSNRLKIFSVAGTAGHLKTRRAVPWITRWTRVNVANGSVLRNNRTKDPGPAGGWWDRVERCIVMSLADRDPQRATSLEENDQGVCSGRYPGNANRIVRTVMRANECPGQEPVRGVYPKPLHS